MSKARLIITAVVVEGRSPSEVAATYGVARSWVYTLVARFRAEGDTEILTWLDDHSRFALSVTVHRRVTGNIVVDTFRACTKTHGIPFSTLTDNGLVYTANSEFRVRHDRIHVGRVSLRIAGNMHHIGLGRTLDGTRVIMLIVGLDVRVIHATTGEIIRKLTINPNRRRRCSARSWSARHRHRFPV